LNGVGFGSLGFGREVEEYAEFGLAEGGGQVGQADQGGVACFR
jgi:hypothetical protein